MRRRRQCAKRSTTATRYGTSSVKRRTSIDQPRTNRCPAQTNVVVPCASSRPWSSEPTSCWAARPISPDARRRERAAAVGERLRRPRACGRDRQGGDPARDERALVVKREREPEVDQLRDDARPAAADSRPARRSCAPPSGRGSPQASEARRRRSRSAARPCPPIASRSIAATTWNGGCAANRIAPSPPNEPASVERNTIVWPDRTREPGVVERAYAACELDERGRAGRVVVGAGPVARVVAMCHDDDRLARLPARDRPQVLEPRPPAPRDRRRPRVRRDRQVVLPHLVAEPCGGEQ